MTRRRAALLLTGTFVLFAAWSLVVPINEAPDEPAHWQYARFLHDRWTLPHYAPGFEEANSPPLAYVLFAPFAVEDASPDMAPARRIGGGDVSLVAPRLFLNTGEDYRRFWPQRAARLLAAAISVGTVSVVWRAGTAAGGAPVGTLAAVFVALLPMFAFRAGHVSNDALLGCGAAAATWGMVRLVQEPFAWRVAWWTSAAVALAYLSKISAIALVPPFALALLLAEPAAAWRDRTTRLLALGLAGVLVAPWSIRNVVLYGDPFASAAMRHAVAHIITERSLFSPFFVVDFPRVLAKSFVGIFGWANLMLPPLLYRPYWLLFAVGLIGVGMGVARRRQDWRLVAVLVVAGLAALAVVIRINLQFTQMQGRYLLPGLPAFAILVAMGLRALPVPLARIASPVTVGLLLLAGNLYALIGVVRPAYHPAPVRTLATGERVMVPSLLTDLAARDGEMRWTVTGPAPSWMAHVDAAADRFASFQVELTAVAEPQAQRACLRYGLWQTPMETNPPVCAEWLADGRPHVVTLPLRGLTGWTAVVTHVRLEPFGTNAIPTGTEVSTRHPRLTPAMDGARSGDTR
jgi:hypothetical protein